MFQEDLFPPCIGDTAAMTADEWLGGANRDPTLISLKDGFKPTEKTEFKAPEKKANEEDSTPKNEKEVSVHGLSLSLSLFVYLYLFLSLTPLACFFLFQLRKAYHDLKEEVKKLQEKLASAEIKIRQLENENKSLKG